MKKAIKTYRDRWRAVEEIERQELRGSTPQENWRQLNAIIRRSIRLEMAPRGDEGEMNIFNRWAVIKKKYESNRRA
jgi:hypothetical protein